MASMIEAHFCGWKMWHDIVHMSHSVIIRDQTPNVIRENLIAYSWRPECVEIEFICGLQLLFDV